jgi:DNA-directed RNA polymerase sigma subunit (sigma70/sigma32)
MKLPQISMNEDTVSTMRNLLKIYSIVCFKETITNREAQVLSEYVIYGCNKKADEAIELNYGISRNNIKQIGSRLQKKGLLVEKQYRKTGRNMHPLLEDMKKLFTNKDYKFLLLEVWK